MLYLVTHVTSIGGLILYDPVLSDPDYIVGSGADTQVLWGAFFEGSSPSPSSEPR